MDNPSYFFLKQILIGFAVAMLCMAFGMYFKTPPVQMSPLAFGTVIATWVTISYIGATRREKEKQGIPFTVKEWMVRLIIFFAVVSVMLLAIGGLKTPSSFFWHATVFLFYGWITYPPKISIEKSKNEDIPSK